MFAGSFSPQETSLGGSEAGKIPTPTHAGDELQRLIMMVVYVLPISTCS